MKGKKLEVYKDGGRYKTSIEAYERFTAPDTNGADPPPPPSVTDRVEWELIDNMVNAGEIVRTGLKLVDGKTVSIN